jgi:hypothetical protein
MPAVTSPRGCGSRARVTSLSHARRRGPLAALLIAAVASGGCLAPSYEIHKPELARLAATPPVLRGVRVEVEQELSATATEPAQPVNERTVVFVGAGFDLGPGHGGGYYQPRPRPSRGGGGLGGVGGGGNKGSSKASDARAAAVAVLVLATFGLIIAGAIESQRYEGTVRLHPMHPVHLYGHDGGYLVLPLAELNPQAVQWADRAVIRSTEGPFQFLERAPLRRRGFTYSTYFGVNQLPSSDGTHTSGPSGLVHFGYFPSQTLGLLATASFAWRENLIHFNTYEQRYGLELQALPFSADIFHAGAYAGGGLAWRLEDGFSRGNDRSLSLDGGVMFQLDVNTHVAITGRFGFYTAHENGTEDPLREATLGISVY